MDEMEMEGRDFRDVSVLVGETGCAQPVGDGRGGRGRRRREEREEEDFTAHVSPVLTQRLTQRVNTGHQGTGILSTLTQYSVSRTLPQPSNA